MIVWPTVFTQLVGAVGLNQGKRKTTCSRILELKKNRLLFSHVAPNLGNGNRLLKKRTEKNLRDNALLL